MSQALTPERVQITDEVLDWRAAIRLCGAPLVADGAVEPRYLDAVIATAERLGPFFDLGKRIAVPHARPDEGARAIALSVLRTRSPVNLLDRVDHPIDVFIMLSALDADSHIGVLRMLAGVLTDDAAVARLKQATTPDEIVQVFDSQ